MYFPTDSVRLLTKDEMAYISEMVSGWTMFQFHFTGRTTPSIMSKHLLKSCYMVSECLYSARCFIAIATFCRYITLGDEYFLSIPGHAEIN